MASQGHDFDPYFSYLQSCRGQCIISYVSDAYNISISHGTLIINLFLRLLFLLPIIVIDRTTVLISQ